MQFYCTCIGIVLQVMSLYDKLCMYLDDHFTLKAHYSIKINELWTSIFDIKEDYIKGLFIVSIVPLALNSSDLKLFKKEIFFQNSQQKNK